MGGSGSGGYNQQKDCADDYPSIDSYNIDKPRKSIQTVTVPCNYGGNRLYYICPRCKSRRRFLYLIKRNYLCRNCAGLNYWTQQTRGIDAAERRVLILLDRLHCYEKYTVDIIAYHTPEKPPRMHWNTYERTISKLRKAQAEYREQYNRDSVRNLCIATHYLLIASRTKNYVKGGELIQAVKFMLERIRTL